MAYQRLEVRRPKDVNTELSEYEMPPEIWSNVENASFRGFRSNRVTGVTKVFSSDPVINPLFHLPVDRLSVREWLYADESSIYKTEGTVHTDISRLVGGAYSATLASSWTGSVFNGVALLNNGIDPPQFVQQASLNADDLTDWPSGYTCKTLRTYKNFMVALNIDTGSAVKESVVKWSDFIDDYDSISNGSGTSWDETDPTTQAGENVLGDTEGVLVDGSPLSDSFILYKTDAAYSMDFIGGVFVFSFRKIFDDNEGLLAKDCVVEFDGKHFVVGNGSVYIHDGTTKKSLTTNRVSSEIFEEIDEDFIERTRVVADHPNREIWVYYVTTGSTTGLADKAAIYNWEDDTWSFRDLFDISHISEGVIETQLPNDWQNQVDTWASVTKIWNTSATVASKKKLLLADYSNKKFLENDVGTTFDGIVFTTVLERVGLDLEDDRGIKYINSVVPHMVGSGDVSISILTQTAPGSSVTHSDPQVFTIDEDYKVDFRESGRYIGIRFESLDDELWSLTGYTLEFQPSGEM